MEYRHGCTELGITLLLKSWAHTHEHTHPHADQSSIAAAVTVRCRLGFSAAAVWPACRSSSEAKPTPLHFCHDCICMRRKSVTCHSVLLRQAECVYSHVQSVHAYRAMFSGAHFEQITPKKIDNMLHLPHLKCLSKVLGHHRPPEQLQCTLALILQVSGTLQVGWNTNLLKDIPSFGVLVESAVFGPWVFKSCFQQRLLWCL